MKAINQLLGKSSEVSPEIKQLGVTLGAVLGRDVKVKRGTKYRADKEGNVFLLDVDSDEAFDISAKYSKRR